MKSYASLNQKGWTLIEVIILIVVVAVATAVITVVLQSGVKKITSRGIDNLVKQECAQVTRPTGNGEFSLTVGQITEFSISDLLGPSLTVSSAKVKWKFKDDKCTYTLEITASDGSVTVSNISTVPL